MENLTLWVDEIKLQKAREIAAERSTSVDSLICEYLDELIARESRTEVARRELAELCKASTAQIGNAAWKLVR